MHIDYSFSRSLSNKGVMVIAGLGAYDPTRGGRATDRLYGPKGPRWFLARTVSAPSNQPVVEAAATYGHGMLIADYGAMVELRHMHDYSPMSRGLSSMLDLALLPPQAAATTLEQMLIEALAWSDEVRDQIDEFIGAVDGDTPASCYHTLLMQASMHREAMQASVPQGGMFADRTLA